MIGLKSPTIVDVENGKEISYSKLLEGKTVEDSSTYHPTSGLWECKNGEVINVAESIRQGKRVVAEPRHYHNNKGMCPTSGKVMDTETGTEIDLIDSILANGGGTGKLDGVPYIFKKFQRKTDVINMTPTCILDHNVYSNVDFTSYQLKLQATTPKFTSEKFYVKFKEDIKGLYFLLYNTNVNHEPSEFKLLLGTKEVDGETEYYYIIRDGFMVDNEYRYHAILMSVLYSQNAIAEAKVIRVLYESENGFNNYVLKNDEEQCYDFYVAQNGSFKKVAKVGYYEYTDDTFLGALGDLRSKTPEDGILYTNVANFFDLEYISDRQIEEDIYVPPTNIVFGSESTTLELDEEDYELMNDEPKPTLWNRTKSKIKSLFNFK